MKKKADVRLSPRELIEMEPIRSRFRELIDVEAPKTTRELLADLPLSPRYVGPEPWLALVRERAKANRETSDHEPAK